MNSSLHQYISRGRAAVFSVLLSTFVWSTPDLAAYPTYPKYYGDGRGLAITAFYVQHWTGVAWEKADTYLPGHSYRIRARFTNFFPDYIPTGGSSWGNVGVHLTDVRVGLRLAGAKFETTQRADTVAFLMPLWIDDHPDFNDVIAPEESRWFNFGHFTWMAGVLATRAAPVQLYTISKEIVHMPPGHWANLVPN